MRVVTKGQTIDTGASLKVIQDTSQSIQTISMEQQNTDRQAIQEEEQVISSEKLQQAVDTVNEFLQVNHSASKFVLHEGLERYFVQVVDAETEEVVKEIPPRKLLDAFYEMQKLLGMIVDEKI
ncbi:flagellar protein FlaG [Lysinibacillus sp. TE18511]